MIRLPALQRTGRAAGRNQLAGPVRRFSRGNCKASEHELQTATVKVARTQRMIPISAARARVLAPHPLPRGRGNQSQNSNTQTPFPICRSSHARTWRSLRSPNKPPPAASATLLASSSVSFFSLATSSFVNCLHRVGYSVPKPRASPGWDFRSASVPATDSGPMGLDSGFLAA